MTPEEAEIFRKELEVFWTSKNRNRVEFTLSKWHIVMYRILGQNHLVRVDFQRRDNLSEDDKRFLRAKRPESPLLEVEA